MNKIILTAVFLSIVAATATGQPCAQSPADCPSTDYTQVDRREDSLQRLANPVLPQEIAMENRLRALTRRIIDRLAARQHWEAVELDESAASGYRAADESVLAYGKRPPHWFTITYQLIVNKDSLRQWKEWLEAFSQRRLDEANASMGRQQAGYKQSYADSANYYGELKVKYMTDHAQQYQQALMSGNKAGSAAYEKEMARYDKKINDFIGRANASKEDRQGEADSKRSDREKQKNTVLFRDGSVLVIQFCFNISVAETRGKPANISARVPAAKMAGHFSNEPDLQDAINLFAKSGNIDLLLLGGWQTKPDENNYYRSSFSADKSAAGTQTEKSLRCDQLQTVAIYLSGNKAAQQQSIDAINWNEINALIVK